MNGWRATREVLATTGIGRDVAQKPALLDDRPDENDRPLRQLRSRATVTPADPTSLASGEPFFGLKQIFTYFFVTIGPLKVLGPFAQLTAGADRPLRRKIAFQAAAYATAGVLLGGYIGQRALESWGVSLPALDVAGSIILFLVAIRNVLDPYGNAPPAEAPKAAPSTALAISPLAFPIIIAPYGIAIVILFLAMERTRSVQIVLLLLLIMLLDLLAMLFARELLRFLTVPLRLLANILNVLQVALAIQMFVFAFNSGIPFVTRH